jgi:hypothetical protein
MATRSNIGILNPDGTVNYIYCHFDGYLEHNGNILNEHYTTEDKVRKLIGLGDLSILGSEIGEKHNFDGPRENKNWCLAYGRDRGETDIEARTIPYSDYTKEYFEEYVYLFTPDKGWEVRQYGADIWSNLDNALQQISL